MGKLTDILFSIRFRLCSGHGGDLQSGPLSAEQPRGGDRRVRRLREHRGLFENDAAGAQSITNGADHRQGARVTFKPSQGRTFFKSMMHGRENTVQFFRIKKVPY